MATVTLQYLTEETYWRCGDKRGAEDAASDFAAATFAPWTQVKAQINAACMFLVRRAMEQHTWLIVDSATIPVVAGTREYNLNTYLLDSGSAPDFSFDLFVERTDTTTPIPAAWWEGGDFRLANVRQPFRDRHFVYEAGASVDLAPGQQPVLLRRANIILFKTTPTQNMTLTAYYVPVLVKLASKAETLATISLTCLNAWSDLIASIAADQLKGDKSSQRSAHEERQLQARMAQFDALIKRWGRVVRVRHSPLMVG